MHKNNNGPFLDMENPFQPLVLLTQFLEQTWCQKTVLDHSEAKRKIQKFYQHQTHSQPLHSIILIHFEYSLLT